MYTPTEARKILDLSRQDVSKSSGLSIYTINQIESGNKHYNIRYETAALLANALGCRVDEIVWPKALTHIGRPPLTGRPINPTDRQTIIIRTETITVTTHSEQGFNCCPTCYIELPVAGGSCGFCN